MSCPLCLYFAYLILHNPLEIHNSSIGKESTCNAGDPGSIPGSGRSTGEGIRLPTRVFLGFLCGSAGKDSTCNEGDIGSIPGLGRPTGEGKGYPLQYSGLENCMHCIVHGVAKRWTQLSDFNLKKLWSRWDFDKKGSSVQFSHSVMSNS